MKFQDYHKTKIILTLSVLILTCTMLVAQCPLFQTNLNEFGGVNSHLKDVNTVELLDGSQDIIVAGTRFTSGFTQEELILTRISGVDGTRTWVAIYSGVVKSRGFDITRFQENGQERIAVTGYIDDGGQFNKTYIAIIDASNGNVIRDEAYDIDPNFHSQGLNIIYTNKNYNGTATPGFLVTGYYNLNYDPNFANNGAGFILRTDLNLNPLWTNSSFSQTTASVDYDMMNEALETPGGYFVTGSVNEPTGSRQGVLLTKFDEQGALLWDTSYVYGNFRDVGVDAYYDTSTDEIYVLTYYTVTHYFGIVVINNTTGVINIAKSKVYQNPNELNRTGFKLEPSANPNFPNDLVIMGYEREGDVINPDGTLLIGNTVPFAVSFDRNSGVINRTRKYFVPYIDPTGYNDVFRFWDGQSPLIYHPEIGFNVEAGDCYFLAGNRSYGSNSTAMEMIKLDLDLLNICPNDDFFIGLNPLTTTSLPININPKTTTISALSLINQSSGAESQDCSNGGILAINDSNIFDLHISPNPASLYISITGDQINSFNYLILDMNGRIISSEIAVTNKTIDISRLSNGLYFLEITEGSQRIIKKFIKN
jgi:hypothetical protein